MTSLFFSEDYFPDYQETQEYIELGSWSSWELSRAGPPENRIVTVEPNGFLNLTNMTIHPHERLESRQWKNYIFRGRLKIVTGTLLIEFRQSTGFSGYGMNIHPIAQIEFTKRDEAGDREYIYAGDLMLIELNKWHDFEIIVKEDYLLITIEDMTLVYRDPHPILFGSINIGGPGQDNSQILLDNLSVSRIS